MRGQTQRRIRRSRSSRSFAFQVPQDFPVALALDLLLSPPTQMEGNITRCTACATVAQPLGYPLVGPGDRHFVPCSHGMRLHSTCHDPAVQTLVPFLDAILGASRVTAERGCPVGTDAHVESIILASAEKAAALIPILNHLLLSDDSGTYAPDATTAEAAL
jgi:hypothetical protein